MELAFLFSDWLGKPAWMWLSFIKTSAGNPVLQGREEGALGI
jgi:hypothetical protein